MSWLAKLFGTSDGEIDGVRSSPSVRRIAGVLDGWEPDRAHHVAAFACVLARVAGADLEVDEEEIRVMEQRLVQVGGLDPEEARLAVELTLAQAGDRGASDQYLATREFRERSSRAERARLLDCAFAVAAADGRITGDESHVALSIAEELGFTRPEALGARSRWREHLAELESGERESR